ncbi:MAG: PQQ-binding-like beta-propeller repeat protein [Phycisphaerales bacterium]|nr:PQQ-binding-like beta-propeller repeat protein [Phycisphaerales bacterium]
MFKLTPRRQPLPHAQRVPLRGSVVRRVIVGLGLAAVFVGCGARGGYGTTETVAVDTEPAPIGVGERELAEYPYRDYGAHHVEEQTELGDWVPVEPPVDPLRGPEPRSVADEVELQYVIGPAVARTLGYRVDWQYPSTGTPLRLCEVSGDLVFTLDQRNFLTCLQREDGDRRWRVPTTQAVEKIFGITYVPEAERVYLTTGSDLLVIDTASGALLDKQRLQQIANTAPVRVGPFLVYGSRSGQAVWHSYQLGSYWRGYQIAQSINLPPVYADGHVVLVGQGGRIMSLRADSATQAWSRRALASVDAPPVAGGGAVYVASLDQHVRAYDIGTARSPLWEYLTESPLSESPVLVGDFVYQQVPSEGLVCLEAQPFDSPGGVVAWTAPEIKGSVVAARGANLLTWAPESRRLAVLDARYGAIAERLFMPQVAHLSAPVPDGDLFAIGTDGRVCRIVPRR